MNTSLRRIMETIDRDFVVEDNTTASVDGYETPKAFGDEPDDVDGDTYTEEVPDTDLYFKAMDEMFSRVNRLIDLKVNKKQIQELTYNDFKSDNTKTDRQKINLNIKEMNRMLREVEQMISHAAKLKSESGADSNVFWKGTLDRFTKINEKLIRLSGKIREMHS